MNVWDVRLKPAGAGSFVFQPAATTALFVLKGRVRLGSGEIAGAAELVILGREGENFEIAALEDATLLFLNGQPIEEPIVGQRAFCDEHGRRNPPSDGRLPQRAHGLPCGARLNTLGVDRSTTQSNMNGPDQSTGLPCPPSANPAWRQFECLALDCGARDTEQAQLSSLRNKSATKTSCVICMERGSKNNDAGREQWKLTARQTTQMGEQHEKDCLSARPDGLGDGEPGICRRRTYTHRHPAFGPCLCVIMMENHGYEPDNSAMQTHHSLIRMRIRLDLATAYFTIAHPRSSPTISRSPAAPISRRCLRQRSGLAQHGVHPQSRARKQLQPITRRAHQFARILGTGTNSDACLRLHGSKRKAPQ